MGVRFYDEALLSKFKKWTAGTQVALTGVDESQRLFEYILDSNNDKPIQLPLIALSRNGGYKILNRNARPLAKDGPTFVTSEINSAKVQVIPIGISYQINIYTRYLSEADEYARNLIFNIIKYPKLTIQLPYENLGIKHDANIRIIEDVEDNSAIPERLIAGQFTRLTLNIDIDDAYLFDIRIGNNVSISPDIDI